MGATTPPDGTRDAEPASLCVPTGVTVETFRVGPDEYAVFCVPLPAWVLPEGLGDAEADIAGRLLRGESAEQIAVARGRSVNTVRNQIRTLYAKLDVSTRAELAGLCRRGSRAPDDPPQP